MSTPLGDFLRARRARLTRADVGLSTEPQRRRVPGLRREEVAQLASISTDYYARLEQGRMQPTEPVIAAVARALQLDHDAEAYLREIAGIAQPRTRRGDDQQSGETPGDEGELTRLQAVLDRLVLAPAFVIDARTRIVAWNQLAAAMITDFDRIPVERRYYIRLLVTDPVMRSLYADWAEVTQLAVEQMRRAAAGHPEDAVLRRLVRELTALDPDFERWWNSHEVAERTAGMKVLRHPVVGELHLDWEALTWNPRPDWQIIVWHAAPGTPSERRLEALTQSAPRDTSRRTDPLQKVPDHE